MKYTKKIEKSISTVEIRLTIEEYNELKKEAYEKDKNNFRVEGFRQGKAPQRFIEKAYGENVFLETAVNLGVNKYYFEILSKEKDLDILTEPTVSVKELNAKGIVIVATAPIMPMVELGEYKGLSFERKVKNITDVEVLTEIKTIQEQSARLVEVTGRPAKMNDVAVIDFEGKVDGVKFDGGTASNYELTLGAHMFIDNFEDQVCGMEIGETKDVNVTFPENYAAEELKGKPAVFTVKLNGIKVKELPELNDEFASNVSEFETLKEYKESVKKDLTEKAKKEAEIHLEDAIVEAVTETSKMDIPQIMIDDQVENDMKYLENNIKYQGLTLEIYAAYMGTTVEQIKKSRYSVAEKSIRAQLVIRNIIEKENIKVEEADMDEMLQKEAENMKMTVEDYKKTLSADMLNRKANNIIVEKVMQFLKENNTITDVQV